MALKTLKHEVNIVESLKIRWDGHVIEFQNAMTKSGNSLRLESLKFTIMCMFTCETMTFPIMCMFTGVEQNAKISSLARFQFLICYYVT